MKNNKKNFFDYVSCEFIILLKLATIIFFIVYNFNAFLGYANDKDVLKTYRLRQNFESLKVNAPSEYNGLTKDEIFNIRQDFVAHSVFSGNNYYPSTSVFKGVKNYKPWWGMVSCTNPNSEDNKENIEGPSRLSSQINNPNALVGVIMSYLPIKTPEDTTGFCENRYFNPTPININYNKEKNMFIATYEISRKFIDYRANVNGQIRRLPLQFSGLNAKDFGYKYVHMLDFRGTIPFYDYDSSIRKKIGFFEDYIAIGHGCKYFGGCNNISPMQEDKMFELYYVPSYAILKLWKEKPRNIADKADIYYKIEFTPMN